MTTPIMNLDCDGFADALADYLEGDAPDGLRTAVEAHASSCAACQQLLTELNGITANAAALPQLTPSRDLWSGIAERIDARVLPMDAPRMVTRMPHRRTWMQPAAAAAALVIMTAGVTYVVTRASLKPAPDSQVAEMAPAAMSSGNPTATIASTSTEDPAADTTASVTAPVRAPVAAASPRAQLTSAPRVAADAADPVFAPEITKLRRIMRERRDLLDPKTVAVLEQSIAVIDSAIAQSRAALAKDPASAFLATQLNHSLEKKVELLRTAALLPART
jgi:hypothetical protein